MRINLAITGSAGGQQWEDALLESRSPKAKQFDKRTSNELTILMKMTLGNDFFNLRYAYVISKDTCSCSTVNMVS